jgi:tetratricopeptide (TPR) repeat protein
MRIKNFITFLLLLILLGVVFFVGRPKLAAFYYNRGCLHHDSSRFNEAIQDFKQSLAINPSVSSVYFMLGMSYESKNMVREAVVSYQKAIEIDFKNIAAVSNLSEIYLKKNDYAKALAFIKNLEGIDPGNQRLEELKARVSLEAATDYVSKGNNAFLAGDISKGYGLVKEALVFRPDFAFAYYTLGFFDMMQHRDKDAIEQIQKALRIDPKFFLAHKLLADIYVKKGRYNEAVLEYQEGLKVNERDASIYNDLGILLDRLERYEEAIRYLKKSLELDPDNLDIRYSLASTYRDNNDFEAAKQEYKKILNVKSDYPHIYNDLGDMYTLQAKSLEAEQSYQNEIVFARGRMALEPRNVAAMNDLAYALNKIGQTAQAKQVIDNALALSPGYSQAYLTLAKIQENLKDFKGAEASLQKAKGAFGNATFIQNDISRIKDEIESFQKEKKEIEFVPPFLSTDKPVSARWVTVTLKNGRKIKGSVKKEDDKKIVLEVNEGGSAGTVTLYREDIDKVE